MKKEIQESINFLMKECNRLKKKQKEKELTDEEKEILDKLSYFIGRKQE